MPVCVMPRFCEGLGVPLAAPCPLLGNLPAMSLWEGLLPAPPLPHGTKMSSGQHDITRCCPPTLRLRGPAQHGWGRGWWLQRTDGKHCQSRCEV